MAHIFSDSMDAVAAAADLRYRWDAFTSSTNYVTISTTGGRLGGPSTGIPTVSAGGTMCKALPAPLGGIGQDALIMSVSHYFVSAPAANRYLMSATNSAPVDTTTSTPGNGTAETWVTLGMNSTGILFLMRSNTVIATATTPLTLNEWKRIEMRVANIDDTGATAEVRVNGVTEISFTGDLYNAGPKACLMCAYHPNAHWRLDDFMILSSAGSTMNGFMGDLVMETIRPTGPGTTTQSTPTGAAASWQAVADVAPNGDTSYASIATDGQKDTYVYGDMATATATVYAVVASMVAKTPGMSPRKIAPVARLSGTEADGVSAPVLIDLTTAYRNEQALVPRPGGGAWTPAEVNAAEFGWKVTP